MLKRWHDASNGVPMNETRGNPQTAPVDCHEAMSPDELAESAFEGMFCSTSPRRLRVRKVRRNPHEPIRSPHLDDDVGEDERAAAGGDLIREEFDMGWACTEVHIAAELEQLLFLAGWGADHQPEDNDPRMVYLGKIAGNVIKPTWTKVQIEAWEALKGLCPVIDEEEHEAIYDSLFDERVSRRLAYYLDLDSTCREIPVHGDGRAKVIELLMVVNGPTP